MITGNPVRTRLQAGLPVFGITITTPSVEASAHAATLGFHFLWVEMEHSPVTLETLRLVVLATPAACPPRSSRECRSLTLDGQACLGSGRERRDISVHWQRRGGSLRGSRLPLSAVWQAWLGAGAAVRTWPQPGNYYDSADREVVTVCVIEQASAISHIDAIAATPGVDVLFVGTSDLSFSLGLRGRQDEPALDAAIARIVEAARDTASSSAPGRHAGSRPQSHGAGFFAVSDAHRDRADGVRGASTARPARNLRHPGRPAGTILNSERTTSAPRGEKHVHQCNRRVRCIIGSGTAG